MSYGSQKGQAGVYAVLALPVFLGIAGLVFDMSLIYAAQIRLNSSTQAAVLAGAEAMAISGADLTSVTSTVRSFSSVSGGANSSGLFSGAAISSGYPALSCLSTVTSVFSVSCYGPSASNALSVKQTASVPLYFLRLFGASSMNLSATATAAMRGSTSAPYNVAIIVDTTRSMSSYDLASNCNNTRLSCALSGVQVLLSTLSPCSPNLHSCGTATNGNVPSSVDRVGLFVFPPVTTSSVSHDSDCGRSSITTASYTNPLPATTTYQPVNFSSDYRSSDASSSLSTSSLLVAAVKGTSGTPCLQAVGGYGTYYAQAIKSAQSALVAEQTLFPGSKNVMIILSDGDASASSSDMPGSSRTSGTYTSSIQECAQAVTAAQTAATAGTRIYSVAYGAAASGCATDTSPSITPCQTMERMASSNSYFYSDYTATGGSSTCIASSQPTTSLNQIFKAIAMDLTVSRLIPNGTQ